MSRYQRGGKASRYSVDYRSLHWNRQSTRFNSDGSGGSGESSRQSNWRGSETNNYNAGSEEFKKPDEIEHYLGPRPKGLRGKEIGLWYAKRSRLLGGNKEKKKKEMKVRLAQPFSELSRGSRMFSKLIYLLSELMPIKELPPLPFRAHYRKIIPILLSNSKKEYIQDILATVKLSCNIKPQKNVPEGSYDHMADSDFKTEFLNNISGSIENKLATEVAPLAQMPERDNTLYNEMVHKLENNKLYKKMLLGREKLPSFSMRKEILELIASNQVVVISGETGCGKTTQVPQFILDDYIEKKMGSVCKIVCTQPRRISAIAVAERVAEERGERLCESTGYSIRLERRHPRGYASIVYCTTGVVLRQMALDPTLQGISHLILDEIHERDVTSDFLLALLKKVIAVRQDLKVILMSATLNAEKFSKYYNNAPHIKIAGFTYPVTEFFLEDVIERLKFKFPPVQKRFFRTSQDQEEEKNFREYIEPGLRLLRDLRKISNETFQQLMHPEAENFNLELVFELIRDICQKEEDQGAILVFLTGYMEISKLNTMLTSQFQSSRYVIIPLHSQMPTLHQKYVFEPAPPGKRKIIIATNIAETSITINDVVFVIDCGKIKYTTYDSETGHQTLLPQWVSKANADQRRGRAGRVKPGVCFHLFSSPRRAVLESYLKPEILRIRLENVILDAKVLQVGEIKTFFESLLDVPESDSITIALELLKRLNALDQEENLTPLGYHLAKLPIAAQMGKMILFGAIFSCLDPILAVAAALDFKDAFLLPLGKEAEVDRKRRELANGIQSDHIVMYEAVRRFEQSPRPYEFCRAYFLSYNIMKMLIDLKRDFVKNLYEMKFVPSLDSKCPECNVNSDNLSLIKAVICAGLYPNVLTLRRFGKMLKRSPKLKTLEDTLVNMHPKSVLNRPQYFSSPLFVYHLKLKSTCVYIHDATVVHPLPIVLFGDRHRSEDDTSQRSEDDGSGNKILTVADKLKFKCTASTCRIIQELRVQLHRWLEYKISHPGYVDWNVDNNEIKVLRAIKDLITSEEMGAVESDDNDEEESEASSTE